MIAGLGEALSGGVRSHAKLSEHSEARTRARATE